MKNKQKMEKIQNPKEHLDLSPQQWKEMKEIIRNSDSDQSIDLGKNREFRFYRLPQNGFSALLSVNNKDVFHFMWEEVPGLVNISHRIVNAKYRNQGIASEVLYAIESRVQRLSNQKNCRFSLMIETSQLSVISLGQKRGMEVTRGMENYKRIKEERNGFQINENSYVSDRNGDRVGFRLSKAFTPLREEIFYRTDQVRSDLLEILTKK